MFSLHTFHPTPGFSVSAYDYGSVYNEVFEQCNIQHNAPKSQEVQREKMKLLGVCVAGGGGCRATCFSGRGKGLWQQG